MNPVCFQEKKLLFSPFFKGQQLVFLATGVSRVKNQKRTGTRKMFVLGLGACQEHKALAFDEALLVQDLRVT